MAIQIPAIIYTIAVGALNILSKIFKPSPKEVKNNQSSVTDSCENGLKQKCPGEQGGNGQAKKDPYKNCKGTVTVSGKKLNIPKCGATSGNWSNPKKPGDSFWKPKLGTPLFIALAEYNKTSIEFKKGYPVFEPFSYKQNDVEAITSINDLEGNRTSDFRKARDAYRQKLKDAGDLNADDWPEPNGNSQGYAPKGYNWHHHQDKKTMVLVPEEIHLSSKGGVRHCGGVFCEK